VYREERGCRNSHTVKKARGNSEGIIRRGLAEKGESGKLLIICRTRLIIAS